MTIDLRGYIEAARNIVANHALSPGTYRRWNWQGQDGTRDLGINPYGVLTQPTSSTRLVISLADWKSALIGSQRCNRSRTLRLGCSRSRPITPSTPRPTVSQPLNCSMQSLFTSSRVLGLTLTQKNYGTSSQILNGGETPGGNLTEGPASSLQWLLPTRSTWRGRTHISVGFGRTRIQRLDCWQEKTSLGSPIAERQRWYPTWRARFTTSSTCNGPDGRAVIRSA